MKASTVGELEELLATIKDKSLPIRIVNEQEEDEENIWVHSIEVSDKGSSGYEEGGEVRLIGNE
jgi:hypothetical protein